LKGKKRRNSRKPGFNKGFRSYYNPALKKIFGNLIYPVYPKYAISDLPVWIRKSYGFFCNENNGNEIHYTTQFGKVSRNYFSKE
jgi:hypothetical protein